MVVSPKIQHFFFIKIQMKHKCEIITHRSNYTFLANFHLDFSFYWQFFSTLKWLTKIFNLTFFSQKIKDMDDFHHKDKLNSYVPFEKYQSYLIFFEFIDQFTKGKAAPRKRESITSSSLATKIAE